MDAFDYEYIAAVLRKEYCSFCKCHPKISVSNAGLVIRTCCKFFEKRIHRQAKDEINRYNRDFLSESFKSLM